jgi:hypothetical protein
LSVGSLENTNRSNDGDQFTASNNFSNIKPEPAEKRVLFLGWQEDNCRMAKPTGSPPGNSQQRRKETTKEDRIAARVLRDIAKNQAASPPPIKSKLWAFANSQLTWGAVALILVALGPAISGIFFVLAWFVGVAAVHHAQFFENRSKIQAAAREALIAAMMAVVLAVGWYMLPKPSPIEDRIANRLARLLRSEKGVNAPDGNDEPTFYEIEGPYTLLLGPYSFVIAENRTRKEPMHVIGSGDVHILDAYIDKGKLYVDASLYGDPTHQVVKIEHNAFNAPPLNWDRNFDSSALEIVDGQNNPRFQLIYRDSHTALVKGIFIHPSGMMVVNDHGMFFNPTEPLSGLKRLFKYPSRLYKGQEE